MTDRLFAASHIAYEIDAMVTGALRCVDIERREGDWTERNINLEAALLHARALIEFLVRRAGQGDYMAPGDFGSDWDTRAYADLARQLRPLNVHLAHLSWGRLDPGVSQVSSTIVYDVLDAFRSFANVLEAEGRIGSQPIRDALAAADRRVTSTGEPALTPASFTTTDTRVTVVGGRRPLDLDLEIELGPKS
jgi:hypothetical protein